MYIGGLIPRNIAELTEAVLIAGNIDRILREKRRTTPNCPDMKNNLTH